VLLSKKFKLFKGQMMGIVEHEYEPARLTVEQAHRLAIYVHETYFRHLRLYDFVLKNTKLSEVKRVVIPVAEPKVGDELEKAMVLAGNDKNFGAKGGSLFGSDKHGSAGGIPSLGVYGGVSGALGSQDPLASLDGTIAREGAGNTNATDRKNADGESVTDSDMDEVVKTMAMDRKGRNVVHRVAKDWNNKITAAVTKEVDDGINVASSN